MARDERCGDCRFHVVAEDEVSVGLCHRYPPRWSSQCEVLSQYPQTVTSDWCGEFEAKGGDDGAR